ncbi:putative lipoprotein YiaD [Tepidimonas alkaliphilus]|uniref:Putative lipoprotein YiaD n=1 Tax=Tepidimonas alkaliphilus TaxID=2588942 RepID=A0A554W7A2_9BURK|nr:OmpA family protein [Tepidimonas alkaliphilus]TSE19440.1 putative lipoprotein YiaD [Tepidimonas alkaliphilus]
MHRRHPWHCAWLLAGAAALALGGCAHMSEEQKSGTAKGAMIGAAAGAVLGAVTDGGKGAVRGAAIGAAAGAAGGYIWSSRMEQQKREMEQATAGTGVAVTQTADNRLKLEIPSDISFDVGRADIKPNFRSVLDTFADGLKRNPAARVTIIGHTDSTGSDAVNNPLSVNRAAAVRDYLVSRGVGIERIAIDGRGSREPIASNATPEGRAKNRRVEIFVAEQAS